LQAQYVAREKDEGKPMWEIVGASLSRNTTFVSSSALRQMTGSFGTSEAGTWNARAKLIVVPYRFLQSRFMDISISDLNNDVSYGRA
jgi:hypothetical protein